MSGIIDKDGYLIADFISKAELSLVITWSSCCSPCNRLRKDFLQIKKEFPELKVAWIFMENHLNYLERACEQIIGEPCCVTKIPAFLLFGENGEFIKWYGYEDPEKCIKYIKQAIEKIS
jgi:thioredoxin-related protein